MFIEDIKPDTTKATDKKWMQSANPAYVKEVNKFNAKERKMLMKRKIQ